MPVVPLEAILPIHHLYESNVLKPSESSLYPFDKSLLKRIYLFQGDITKLEIDCIVNAANRSLLGGGGVDGAIHAAAGPKLLGECRDLNGCATGEAKITKGYDLPVSHIIHAVGPVYSSEEVEERSEQLSSCYKNGLDLALKHSLKHIAFPSISTGIYGWPIEHATHLACDEVRKFCDSNLDTMPERIIFVVWSDNDRVVYEKLIPQYFPPEESQHSEVEAAAAPEISGQGATTSDYR